MEAVEGQDAGMELELRGGAWEVIHAVVFYIAVALALMATFGVWRLTTGIVSMVLLFYSIFAIFSSPSYFIVDPSREGALIKRYHYFAASERDLPRESLEGLLVTESSQPPSQGEERASRRDLSYYVKIYLQLREGGKLKIYRTSMTGSPLENREKAFLISEFLAGALDLPVLYRSGRGEGQGLGDDPPRAE